MTSKTNILKFSRMEAGERHHRLTAVAFVRRAKRGNAIWKFQCDCGNTHDVVATCVRSGNTKSCGCLKREADAAKRREKTTHGMCWTREYEVWCHIIQRCKNPNEQNYPNYGGRGITVCDRWRESFEEFYADMGPKPSPKHTIERINNAGNYEPENCRWATRKEQDRNKRSNRLVIIDGTTMTLFDAVEESGLNYKTVLSRIVRGWSVERALGTAARKWPSQQRASAQTSPTAL